MANPSEINPKLHSADAEQSGPHGPEDKIYRLTRSPPEAKNASGPGEAAKPELKAWPDDRKPQARPSDEPPLVPA
jgi:membrane fusion protein (multidrug efflux system)